MDNPNKNGFKEYAQKQGRDYMTPEDVTHALKCYPAAIHKIRYDTLEMIGLKRAEDPTLCAMVAFNGTESSKDYDHKFVTE